MPKHYLDYASPPTSPTAEGRWRPARKAACVISAFNLVVTLGAFVSPELGGTIAFLGVPLGNIALVFCFLVRTPFIWHAKGRAAVGPYLAVAILAPPAWAFFDFVVLANQGFSH